MELFYMLGIGAGLLGGLLIYFLPKRRWLGGVILAAGIVCLLAGGFISSDNSKSATPDIASPGLIPVEPAPAAAPAAAPPPSVPTAQSANTALNYVTPKSRYNSYGEVMNEVTPGRFVPGNSTASTNEFKVLKGLMNEGNWQKLLDEAVNAEKRFPGWQTPKYFKGIAYSGLGMVTEGTKLIEEVGKATKGDSSYDGIRETLKKIKTPLKKQDTPNRVVKLLAGLPEPLHRVLATCLGVILIRALPG